MAYAIGLVGVGGFGRVHGETFAAIDGIDLVAIADVDAGALAERGDAWGVRPDRRYASHGAMLEAEDLDAVSVATPAARHRRHVVDAARSRAEPTVIFVEKPIAASVAGAREMVAACDERGIELVVDHTRRFDPAYGLLRESMDDWLGDLLSVHASTSEELLRVGVHFADLVPFLTGARAVEVRGGYLTGRRGIESPAGRFDDSGGGGTVVLDGGAHVTIDATVPREAAFHALSFVGTAGALSIDREPTAFDARYWPNDDGHAGAAAVGERLRDRHDPEGMYRHAATHVVDLLDGAAENASPGTDAVHALATIVAMFVSHYVGGAVSLPLDLPLESVTIAH